MLWEFYGRFPVSEPIERACTSEGQSRTRSLLDLNFLLQRIDSSLGVLRRNRDHAFPRWQGWGEVVKAAIGPHHRHFPAVDHDPRPHFGLAAQLDHPPMLHQG